MQKPENSTLVNVCIIPDEQVSVSCVSISQSLGGENTLFTLGDDKFAHMTVYMARFGDEELEKVVKGAEKALQDVSSFKCEHTGYFMTEGRYLEVSYAKSAELMDLHESLIEQLAGYRKNPGDPYEESFFAPYTKEQRQNAEYTGYDLARNLYRPHISLTRYTEGGVPQKLPDFPEAQLSFSLSKIGIYKADDNGAVYELIKEYRV